MLSICEDVPFESIERRHGSASAELEQLSQATVAILQHLSALNVLFPACCCNDGLLLLLPQQQVTQQLHAEGHGDWTLGLLDSDVLVASFRP